MKSLLILVLICGTSLANLVVPKDLTEFQTNRITRGDLNENIKEVIQNIIKRMPCGMPEMGVPILAPYEKEYYEVEYHKKFLEMVASFFDLRVDGLDSLKVDNIKLSALTLKAEFDFHLPEIQTTGDYVSNIFLIKIIRFSGNGKMDITLKDLRFTGSLQIGANENGLFMKNFKIIIKLGSLKSDITGLLWGKLTGKLANKAFEMFIPGIISRHQSEISEMVESEVIAMADDMLAGLTVADILEAIANGMEPIECIPPKTYYNLNI